MTHRIALIALGLLVCAGCGDIGGGKRRQASGSAGGAGLVGSDINSLAAPAQPAQPPAQTSVAPPAAMTHHVFHVAGVEAKKELVHRLASGAGRRKECSNEPPQ